MKVLALFLILCIVGALCHREHHGHPGHPGGHPGNPQNPETPSSHSTSTSTPAPSGSGDQSVSPSPAPTPSPRPNVHNRIRIQFDGQDHQGWLLDCVDAQMEDSPTGCSAFPHHVVSSSNVTHNNNRQECARKCQLNDQQIQFLAQKELKKSIKIEAYEFDQKHSHHAVCELNWTQFLVGYNLQVHYLWVDHVETPFLEVKSCKAEAIESPTPLQTGDQFIASRELVLDERINFLATVLSLSLMILAFTLLCCAMTCCVTCLCLKACEGSKLKRRNCRRARRHAVKAAATKTSESDLEMNEMKSIPQQTVPATGVAPSQVPMYIPYYMFNPYSAGQVFQTANGEQTFVMPNAPQV